MKKANFRFLLYGMESANQETLDKLDKGMKVHEIEKGVRMAKKAGLVNCRFDAKLLACSIVRSLSGRSSGRSRQPSAGTE